MRIIPLDMRLGDEHISLDRLEIVLVHIDHPLFDKPLRLASSWVGPRLRNKPPTYGVRSTWRNAEGEPYLYILMSAVVPDEVGLAPAAASLMVEVFDDETGPALLSTTEPATVHMALILGADPNDVQREWSDLDLTGAPMQGGDISLDLSKEARVEEPFPVERFTKDRYPGQHR